MSLKKVVLGTAVVLGSANVFAYEAGDFILRAGVASVQPDESASPDIVGVGNDEQLGITGVYMFTKNIGLEVLASTPFTHSVDFAGALSGNGSLADVTHLPPTVSVQYYFDTGINVTPYVGVGVNYWWAMESEITSNGKAVLATLPITDTSLEVDDSIGLAFSAGVDAQLSDNLVLNAAVWNIDVDTEADVGHGALKVDIDIDPWVYMVGLGYKF